MSTPERPFALKAETRPCDRLFVDAAGVSWCVRERQFEDHGPALYFENAQAFRRVSDYPRNWRDLSAGDLELLSLHP